MSHVQTINIGDCFEMPIDFADFLLKDGMVSSKSEYDRLAKAGAISIRDGGYASEKVFGRKAYVPLNTPFIVRVGKLKLKGFTIHHPQLAEINAEVREMTP
jgi:hypothetical protein